MVAVVAVVAVVAGIRIVLGNTMATSRDAITIYIHQHLHNCYKLITRMLIQFALMDVSAQNHLYA